MYIKKNINIIYNYVISHKARLSVVRSCSVVLNVGVNFYSRFSIVRHEDEPEPRKHSGNARTLVRKIRRISHFIPPPPPPLIP